MNCSNKKLSVGYDKLLTESDTLQDPPMICIFCPNNVVDLDEMESLNSSTWLEWFPDLVCSRPPLVSNVSLELNSIIGIINVFKMIAFLHKVELLWEGITLVVSDVRAAVSRVVSFISESVLLDV